MPVVSFNNIKNIITAMSKSCLSILFLFFTCFNVQASHIVGGEIELTKNRGYVYQIKLKMYVDQHNQNPNLIESETTASVGIYRKGTNQKMDEVVLKRQKYDTISYGESCAASNTHDIETGLIIFSEGIYLDPAIYNSASGYYIVWENCCRNIIIENIVNPVNEGMAFYMEFPPVIKNGITFSNNSPQFKDISGDFLCKNKRFTFDFSGTDFNGDSLVYRRATPLAGHATTNATRPQPGPYDPIIWAAGYDVDNQIPGLPSNFYIHPHTGLIDFTPTVEGLFVFSVEVDEYRDGVKIGMVKRDFQFLVITCPPNAPVAIEMKLPDGSYYNSLTDTLQIRIEQDTCFSFLVSDSNTIKYNQSENLFITVNSNLPPGVLAVTQNVTVSPGNDTASVMLCFNACNKLYIDADTLFNIEVISTDAPKCPMSLAYYDTLRIKVLYKPQVNAKPAIGIVPAVTSFNAVIGQVTQFDIYGTDEDPADVLVLSAFGEDFTLPEMGMVFNSVSGTDSISSQFQWMPSCEHLAKGSYKVNFVVDDNSCIKKNTDTISVVINVSDKSTELPGITPVNLITPNGDGLNDVFEVRNIPEGNCEYFFKKVIVYNRWGSKVYESTKPDFKWDAEKISGGMYYYIIDINKKQFRGWLEVKK
jgi:gliding motility-associated-like protein